MSQFSYSYFFQSSDYKLAHIYVSVNICIPYQFMLLSFPGACKVPSSHSTYTISSLPVIIAYSTKGTATYQGMFLQTVKNTYCGDIFQEYTLKG